MLLRTATDLVPVTRIDIASRLELETLAEEPEEADPFAETPDPEEAADAEALADALEAEDGDDEGEDA